MMKISKKKNHGTDNCPRTTARTDLSADVGSKQTNNDSLPPILPLIQQSGLSQVLASIPSNASFVSQTVEQPSKVYCAEPLSPQIPNSQQLQAQLLASLPRHGNHLLWNENKSNVTHNIGTSISSKAVNVNQNEVVANSGRNVTQTNSSNFQEVFLSLNATTIQSALEMVARNTDLAQQHNAAESKGEEKTEEHRSNKSRSRSLKGQQKTAKKSQKIKQILSSRISLGKDPGLNHPISEVPSQLSTCNQGNNVPIRSKIPIISSDSQTSAQPKPQTSQLFASNLMRKVLIEDMKASLQPLPAVKNLMSSITPNGLSQLMPNNVQNLQAATVEARSFPLLSTVNSQQITSLPPIMPMNGAKHKPPLKGPYSLPSVSTVAKLMTGNKSTSLNSGSTQLENPTTTSTHQPSLVTQLSPGSLSVMTSLLGQLANTDTISHVNQSSSVVNQSAAKSKLPMVRNAMMQGSECQLTACSLQQDPSVAVQRAQLGTAKHQNHIITQSEQQDPSLAVQRSQLGTAKHQDHLIAQSEQQNSSLAVQRLQSGTAKHQDNIVSFPHNSHGQSPFQQGSIFIPLNQYGSNNVENVTVTYQQLQTVLNSLISGLQGQLDATQKLVPSVMASSVQSESHTKQVDTGLNQPLNELSGSNPISDIPYSFVQFPLGNNSRQTNCSLVDQSSDISTVEPNQSLINNRTDHLDQITGAHNREDVNQLSGESGLVDEQGVTEGNQMMMMMNVEDSFLSEQPEHLYDDQNFLYNKTNMETYMNSRNDNPPITMDTINGDTLSNQVPLELSEGCENLSDSNAAKNQMMLSHDPEEDMTDVPNIFKQYCLSCKAAMLNDECQFHKINYNHIKDTPILSRARTSIPSCLTLQPTSTFGNYNVYLGVWTKENIPAQTKFGPLVGKITPESERKEETAPCFPGWKIFLDTRSEMIDMCDENECNWMMFIKPARCEKTQNLIAHQLGHHIYFFTTKEVFCGQELLFWFSKEYATLSGLPFLPGEASLSECLICGKVFIDKSTRKLHMKEHPHFQKYKCHICDHLYSSLSSLNRHTMIHMGVKPHICHVCHKNFSDNSNLKVHLKVHTGMKLFSCNICQKTFRQKAHLKTHLVIHTGQKNLKCYFCDKTFAREGDRKQHEYQHTKEKTFKCEQCGKVFYKLQNYKRHLLIHTGERNFECQYCMKLFGRKFHLQRHMEKCQARNEIFEDKDLILNNVDLKGILNS